MTREETLAAAKVMMAYAEGARIQVRAKGREEWLNWEGPKWDWERLEYRVRPEPQEVFIWVRADHDPVLYSARRSYLFDESVWTKKKFREVIE
jgi:hypothetical protein